MFALPNSHLQHHLSLSRSLCLPHFSARPAPSTQARDLVRLLATVQSDNRMSHCQMFVCPSVCLSACPPVAASLRASSIGSCANYMASSQKACQFSSLHQINSSSSHTISALKFSIKSQVLSASCRFLLPRPQMQLEKKNPNTRKLDLLLSSCLNSLAHKVTFGCVFALLARLDFGGAANSRCGKASSPLFCPTLD